MKDINAQVEKLNALVLEFYNVDIQDGNKLSTMHQKITGVLYFMEETRAEIHDLWQTKVYKLVEGGASVSRAENEAHVEYPQMYRLRRLIEGGYSVAFSISQRVRQLNNEMKTING